MGVCLRPADPGGEKRGSVRFSSDGLMVLLEDWVQKTVTEESTSAEKFTTEERNTDRHRSAQLRQQAVHSPQKMG